MAHKFKKLSEPILADPCEREKIEQITRASLDAVELTRLREARGMTQRQIAETLDVSQANISRIEHEEDLYLSTLSGYVAALGGRLELRAVFPDQTVEIVPACKS
jgi:DNA-binding XRE family transcriptional regulator